jgi:trans-aconitate methyltransferase
LINGKKSYEREWDASSYHRLSAPQTSWGEKVLSRLMLRGDETILDAGCGTGRLTASLVAVLPRGRVLAVDQSENMLIEARAYLAPHASQIQVVAADFANLPFHSSLDGIFSTASFHWVKDHRGLFRSLFQALKPSGWLIAQCGGGENLSRLRKRMRALASEEKYRAYLETFEEPWFFSDSETAGHNLGDVGFLEIETSMEPASTRFEDFEHYSSFVRTSIVHRHLNKLPTRELQQAFLDDLAELAQRDTPPFELDYWRLNLKARKPR